VHDHSWAGSMNHKQHFLPIASESYMDNTILLSVKQEAARGKGGMSFCIESCAMLWKQGPMKVLPRRSPRPSHTKPNSPHVCSTFGQKKGCFQGWVACLAMSQHRVAMHVLARLCTSAKGSYGCRPSYGHRIYFQDLATSLCILSSAAGFKHCSSTLALYTMQ
jgi:hypothetical protein